MTTYVKCECGENLVILKEEITKHIETSFGYNYTTVITVEPCANCLFVERNMAVIEERELFSSSERDD